MSKYKFLSIIIIGLAVWVSTAPITASQANACPVSKSTTAGS